MPINLVSLEKNHEKKVHLFYKTNYLWGGDASCVRQKTEKNKKIKSTLWLLDKVILFNLITLFDYNAISVAKRSSHGNLINYNVKMNKKYM